MKCRCALFSAALLAAPCIPVVHALEWERTLIELDAKPADEVVRTKFVCKNPSHAPVHILGVSTSCGCTEAQVSASEIAPQGAGTLYILFTIGKRTGLQEKEIVVQADDSDVPQRLTLRVHILPPARRHPAAGPQDGVK